jgi:DNA repair protein RecN (Recombination protein N)
VCAGHQVICITHLPQVAVHGTTHYVVTKSVSDGRTRTDIGPVAREAREAEIARMLGGRDLSGAARRHARDMLKRDA